MPDPALLPDPGEMVVIASLGRARGLKGEIFADGWSDVERYGPIRRVWMLRPDGTFARDGMPATLESVRPVNGRLVMKFSDVATMSGAEALTGCTVVIPKSERLVLPDDEYYLADLVGCEVVDRRSGSQLGWVTGWQEFGGPELLEIRPKVSDRPEELDSSAAVWIPFAKAICVEIDVSARRIVVDPPEGLLELNA